MQKNRLEAFSDGVLAIILTVMVLELKVPHGASLADLAQTAPTFLSYVLSFLYVGIYWSNHHHLFQLVDRVNGRVLWANNHLLFWLSLLPFATAWAGENHFAPVPVAAYGLVLGASGVAYVILTQALKSIPENAPCMTHALGNDAKGKASIALYSVAVGTASWWVPLSLFLYLFVALLWIVPDARIEKIVK